MSKWQFLELLKSKEMISHLCGLKLRLPNQIFLLQPLTWIVCIFHAIEKTCATYFWVCEGTDPKSPSYDGPVGSQFKNGLVLEPIVRFHKISGLVKTYPKAIVDGWNHDLRYLYHICHAIQNGFSSVSDSLAKQKPGKVHQVLTLNLYQFDILNTYQKTD